MLKKSNLLLSAGVLALAAVPLSPANAAAPMGFAGTVGGSYGNSEDVDSWNIGGSGAFGFGQNFAGQVDLGYNSVEDADVWNVGGSLFYAPAMGRAGITVQHLWLEEGGVDVDATRYGVFGEFYASDVFTFGAQAGGMTGGVSGFGVSGDESGWYVGGLLTGYAMPNLAIQGNIDFSSADDVDSTTFGIGAEFLVSETVPIAIFGGYAHTNVDAGAFGEADVNTWLIGVRFYFGDTGPTLVDKHRNGTVGWIVGGGNTLLTP
jgi:hypothetical protein